MGAFMTSNYLVDHAIDNVWCSPGQDFQVVVKPARLTNYRGLRKTAQVGWQEFNLPNFVTTFHLFQIGNLHPGLLGLFPAAEQWIKASDHCNIQGMVIDIYGKMGVRLPRFETWFTVLGDNNLIMAIADQGGRFDVSAEDVFVRFYSNAFYESPRSNGIPTIDSGVYLENPDNSWTDLGGLRAAGSPGDVLVEGKRLATRAELMTMQDRYTHLKALGVGQVLCYYNGELVNDFSGSYFTTTLFQVGDWAEIMVDASVQEVLEFPIAEADTFDSILDGLRKYLLHRPTDFINTIQFKDDLDFYLIRKVGVGSRYVGRYYYQNTQRAVRMVTHQDWAIPVPFVLGYADQAGGFTSPMDWVVRVYVRRSGFERPLVDEAMRIKELYRLDPDHRRRAMLGLDSTLSFWRADILEASAYTSLMGRLGQDFTLDEVASAYGYNAISKLVADSPLPVTMENGNPIVVLPVGLQGNSTIYEYGSDGLLLGWYNTYGTTHYSCRNLGAAFVEGRVGVGGTQLSTKFGTEAYQLDPNVDYFFLKAPIWNGAITGEWQVAEEGVDYVVRQGVAYWNLDNVQWLCAIRNGREFLAYSIELDARDGLMIFSIQSEETSQYEPANRVEPVPYGKLDLWLNKRSLIEGIDYVVRWPQVVICNKEFLVSGTWQTVDIRCTGLPMVDENGGFVRQLPLDVGFVKYGQLSRNNRYNVREDKVQRIVARGRVKRPGEVSYPEDGPGISVAGIQNGDPYAIEEVIVPIANFTQRPTAIQREQAMLRDRQLEDYMSQFITDPVEGNANPIPERYDLFSPFLAKIIHDIQHGFLVIDRSIVPLTNSAIEKLLGDYFYLLEYDPVRLNLDDSYVIIHPHELYQTISLGVYEFYLVEKAAQLYLGDKVHIGPFLQIDANWVPIPVASS